MKMKKGLTIMASCCLLTACHERLEDRAAREATEYTQKNCPSPVRDNTRTDSLTFDKATKTLGYWYTLCGNADNAEGINQQKEQLINTLRTGVRQSTQLKTYKEAGFNIRYVYHSEKNPQEVLLDVTFTEKDY